MFVNRRPLRIEWGDCDPAGIVFFPRYMAFFDASTAHLFEAAGFPEQALRRDYGVVGCPMVDLKAKFHVPCRFGEDVVVESFVEDWRRSSFDVRHRLFKAGDVLAVESWETRVWAGPDPEDPSRIKAKPTPAEVVDRLTGRGGGGGA